MASETSKYRHLTLPYCRGAGCDIGSGGDPVKPSAIQIELSPEKYAWYNSGNSPAIEPHFRSDTAYKDLPFKDKVLDYCYSSHLLEDFTRDQWKEILPEWVRVVKPGGFLVILVPDCKLWNYAITELKQPPNCSHAAPEPHVGELSSYAPELGLLVLEDRLTECYEHDYSILFVGQRL